ncbi:hypothetical protein EV421DRAFT_404246 [Armillaria borealis]|uniref:Secreted protein n=1 Tax=Armillaria borealis TaxID=47425 RepID=A0AA39IVS9_9AGAR|nr:hypothetical protein EV421DRAFT_404246 [Armillaria borealis]
MTEMTVAICLSALWCCKPLLTSSISYLRPSIKPCSRGACIYKSKPYPYKDSQISAVELCLPRIHGIVSLSVLWLNYRHRRRSRSSNDTVPAGRHGASLYLYLLHDTMDVQILDTCNDRATPSSHTRGFEEMSSKDTLQGCRSSSLFAVGRHMHISGITLPLYIHIPPLYLLPYPTRKPRDALS